MALDLRVSQGESCFFFYPDGRNGAGAAFDEVAEAKDAVISFYFAPFSQENDAFHFIWSHAVHELVLELLDVVVVLENVEYVFMLKQFFFEVVGTVATVGELHPTDHALLLHRRQLHVNCSPLVCQQYYSNLRRFLPFLLRLETEGLASLGELYLITRFSS